jgi:hypothetical protein
MLTGSSVMVLAYVLLSFVSVPGLRAMEEYVEMKLIMRIAFKTSARNTGKFSFARH